MDKIDKLIEIYPFNLARAIIGEEDDFKIYLPGLLEEVNKLDLNEKNIIEWRFLERITLENCGNELGVSRERIRQIEATALRRLRLKKRKFIAVPEESLNISKMEYSELKDRYEALKELCEQSESNTKVEEIVEERVHESIYLDDLGLSVRAYNVLKRGGCDTLGDIAKLNMETLIKMRNMGKKTLEEVIDKLSEFGITIEE